MLEHGTATFYLTGVSRSFTHELVRHRHFSYSQLSQRYVPERDAAMVEPDVIADDPELHKLFVEATEASVRAYNELLAGLERRFADGPNGTLRRKQARQAARAVLPNATETRIVVTGNYRAWRHFIAMRATEHADVEIRELAVAVPAAAAAASRRTSSPTSRSARCPTAPRSPPARTRWRVLMASDAGADRSASR